MKKIIIRADGNAKIGAGHLMRCLTVAEQIEQRENVLFVCADQESAGLVLERGFSAFVLGTEYRDMMSELPLWEQMRMQNVGGLLMGDVVILVDSYFADADYLKALQAYGKVFLMDDLAADAKPVDGIINYNAYASEELYEPYEKSHQTRFFTGSGFTPVRPEFVDRDYRISEQVNSVLLTTGGGDRDNIAGHILEVIYREGIVFKVVTGRFNPNYEVLCEYAKAHPGVEILHDVKDMAGLMLTCDMAITAGGTTVYELCSIGVPFICFSYAENQEKAVSYMSKKQIALSAGKYHVDAQQCLEEMKAAFDRLLGDHALRRSFHKREKEVVDGRGAKRIAALLEK
ncbi:MAG: UDP-2,4-diacetamido-2,4,6-trideoxy-beta-L-altropyranose hydrolase [Lachnospiraceae bacterium]|nr:UDP-2,4-diacetamido-2,4,6-trideoxy-beta-L-altropyranose hydrolase [Lachnospiraceae bacterium]